MQVQEQFCLVAPVARRGSLVAAGSVVTKDIPEKMLGIARPRQEIRRLPGARV